MVNALKIVINSEIHKVSQVPKDFDSLITLLQNMFSQLKQTQFSIQYEDSEGDNVMLTNDEDYKAMFDSESHRNSIKIYISVSSNNLADTAITANPPENDELARLQAEQERISLEQTKLFEEEKRKKEEEAQAQQRALLEMTQKLEAEAEELRRRAEEEERKKLEEEAALQAERMRLEAEEAERMRFEAEQAARRKVEEEEAEKRRLMEEQRLEEEEEEERRKIEEAEAEKLREEEAKRKAEAEERERLEYEREMAVKLAELKRQQEEERLEAEREYARLAAEENAKLAAVEADARGNNQPNLEDTKKALREVLSGEFLPQISKLLKGDEQPQVIPQEPIIQIQEKVVFKENIPQQAQEILNVVDDILKIYQKIPDYQREIIDVSLEDNIRKIFKIKGVAVPQAQKPVEPQKPIEEGKEPQHDEHIPKEILSNPPQQIDKPKESPYNVQLVKEVSQIPQKVTTRDSTIYKTVALKNTGTQAWPKNTKVVPVNSAVNAQESKLTQVQPGKEFSSVLILQNPQKAGQYTSMWRLCFVDERQQTQYIGEAFPLTLVIGGNNPEPSPQYSQEILKKAQDLKGILADANIVDLQKLVSKNPKASIEELVNAFFANN